MRHTDSARRRGPFSIVLLGSLVAFGVACQDQSRLGEVNGPVTDPALAASSSSLPHINNTNLVIPTSTYADLSAYDCSNNPGPYISMESGMSMSGLSARIIFRNNDNPVGGPHQADETTASVTLIPPGFEYRFPKQPVLGGVGGNPWILAGFTDAAGSLVGDRTLLGRCVQLSQALGS